MPIVTLTGVVRVADYLSVEEAADRLGVTKESMRQKLYLDEFTTYKWYNMTLVSVREIDKQLKDRKSAEDLY